MSLMPTRHLTLMAAAALSVVGLLAGSGVRGAATAQTGVRSAAPGSGVSPSHLDSGVRGRVFYGPTCPVQGRGRACVRPYQATISVRSKLTNKLVAQARSSVKGDFSIQLGSGSYLLVPRAGRPYLRSPAREITVRSHRYTTVIINFDSGIR